MATTRPSIGCGPRVQRRTPTSNARPPALRTLRQKTRARFRLLVVAQRARADSRVLLRPMRCSDVDLTPACLLLLWGNERAWYRGSTIEERYRSEKRAWHGDRGCFRGGRRFQTARAGFNILYASLSTLFQLIPLWSPRGTNGTFVLPGHIIPLAGTRKWPNFCHYLQNSQLHLFYFDQPQKPAKRRKPRSKISHKPSRNLASFSPPISWKSAQVAKFQPDMTGTRLMQPPSHDAIRPL